MSNFSFHHNFVPFIEENRAGHMLTTADFYSHNFSCVFSPNDIIHSLYTRSVIKTE